MQTLNPAPFLKIINLSVAGSGIMARPDRVTVTLEGWDGAAAELVSLTATLDLEPIDPQRSWRDVQLDLIAQLRALLDPERLLLRVDPESQS